MNARPSPGREFRAWNEQMVEKYHPSRYHHSRNLVVRWIERKRTMRLLTALDPRPSDCVLDVGCGAGDILVRVPCGRLWGIDISPRLVAEAQEKLGTRATIVCSDAESMESAFPGLFFDRIYCSEVLEHVLHPDRVVQAMTHLLKPGGRIVVSVPNERLINAVKGTLRRLGLLHAIFGGQIAERMDDEWHLHTFMRREACALLEEAGLKVGRVWGIPFYWLPFRYVLLVERCVRAVA